MKETLRPRKERGILSRTLDGETVIVKKENHSCFFLNKSASFLWNLSNGRRSVKELAGSLSRAYGVRRIAARKDAKALLSHLARHSLVSFSRGRNKRI